MPLKNEFFLRRCAQLLNWGSVVNDICCLEDAGSSRPDPQQPRLKGAHPGKIPRGRPESQTPAKTVRGRPESQTQPPATKTGRGRPMKTQPPATKTGRGRAKSQPPAPKTRRGRPMKTQPPATVGYCQKKLPFLRKSFLNNLALWTQHTIATQRPLSSHSIATQ